MNGELAEVICLATRGTNWLQQELPAPTDFERSNSTFQFVGSAQFVSAQRSRLGRHQQASTVTDWITNCRSAWASRIWLVIPGISSDVDQYALAFANAGQWGFAVETPNAALLWRATWTVADSDAPDRRIWSVRYDGSPTASFNPQRPDFDQAQNDLIQALYAVKDFAAEQSGLANWVDWFRRALDGADEIGHAPRAVCRFGAEADCYGLTSVRLRRDGVLERPLVRGRRRALRPADPSPLRRGHDCLPGGRELYLVLRYGTYHFGRFCPVENRQQG